MWPGLPMLALAKAALDSRSKEDREKMEDSTALQVFVPQCRVVQKRIQELMELKATHPRKIWVEEEFV
jgi:hypothetical protein